MAFLYLLEIANFIVLYHEKSYSIRSFTDELTVDKEFKTCFYIAVKLNKLNTLTFQGLKVKLCIKVFNRNTGKWAFPNINPTITIKSINKGLEISGWKGDIYNVYKSLNSIDLPFLYIELETKALGLCYIEVLASVDKKEDIEIGYREIYISQEI